MTTSSAGLGVLAVLTALTACATEPAVETEDPACEGKCDGATSAVVAARANLLANLMTQMDTPNVLFGHQRFNITGVNTDGTQWFATETALDRSDVDTIAGDHPVVLGFDAWDLAIKPEDWIPTPKVNALAATRVHELGGIVAIDWHLHGCVTDQFSMAGNEACLCRLANDDAYARAWLLDTNYKRLADTLVRYGLDKIPIIFRPFHEHNGAWFWWGKPAWSCASHVANPRFTGAAAYARLYRTVITYLRVERGLANLLVAYSPNGGEALASDAGYLDGYPGDEYVDILGADLYYQAQPSFAVQTESFRRQLQNITKLARARGKVAALTETGNTQLASETAQSHWFSQQLLPLLESPGVDVAYALTWENRTSGPQQFWVPYGDHPGVADFRAFVQSPTTQLLADAPAFDRAPDAGYAVCTSCSSDPDGDRWGWERGASCRVGSWCLAPQFPICKRCGSDPDEDGWGWENARSCEVLPTCR